jgi:hypothetical protein
MFFLLSGAGQGHSTAFSGEERAEGVAKSNWRVLDQVASMQQLTRDATAGVKQHVDTTCLCYGEEGASPDPSMTGRTIESSKVGASRFAFPFGILHATTV